MSKVLDRFLRYVAVDTQSDEDSTSTPSTPNQWILARMLADELKEIGVSDVRLDEEHCYVYGEIPANTDAETHTLGFVSHMDTAQERPGDASGARVEKDYDGRVIRLNDSVSLDPAEFPELMNYIGCDIVVSDGNSLLGGDDKAGVAEIMTMAERLLSDPSIKHGKVCIGFTPDEEIGRGTDYFDIKGFSADFAYTVDGGAIGELEYENFNAAAAYVRITGRLIHPGDAKGVMINAACLAARFDSMLPSEMRPEYTEGYEGFFHLFRMSGNAGYTEMQYLIRDHDSEKFENKKNIMRRAADYLNSKYPGAVQVEIVDTYRNMKEVVEPHMFLIDDAKAAFSACGVEPKVVAIRGGTDGARLSYCGIPCPNLSTGGHNFHSNHEYIPVQSMEKMVDVLTEIVRVK